MTETKFCPECGDLIQDKEHAIHEGGGQYRHPGCHDKKLKRESDAELWDE
jgi:hypothetical protein